MLRDLVFSAGFAEFVAKAGIDVRRRGESIVVIDHEAGFSLSAPEPGWFEVRRFSRGVVDTIDSRFRRADDLERYLLLSLGLGTRLVARPDLPPLVQPSIAVEVAPGYAVESIGPHLVAIRDLADDERGIELDIRGFGRPEGVVELTYLLGATPDEIRSSWLEQEGEPIFARFRVVPGSRAQPSSPKPVEFEALDAEDRALADRGVDLFRSLAAKSGKPFDDPVSAVPFDGGVAVVRAIRGGGKILVAHDGSALFRSSSFTFGRALADFRAGRRSPIESFG